MAKASLSVELYRKGKWQGTLRKYGGNKSDVQCIFVKYIEMSDTQFIDSFPNFTFQDRDNVRVLCRWGIMDKII